MGNLLLLQEIPGASFLRTRLIRSAQVKYCMVDIPLFFIPFRQWRAAMKQCQFCGSELPEDARFCGHCGREQKSLTAIDEARGKITFTETYTSDIIVFTSSNPPTTCTMNGPHVDQQLTGSYTDQHVFHGTISYPGVPRSAYTCNTSGFSFFLFAQHGTWTGQIAS